MPENVAQTRTKSPAAQRARGRIGIDYSTDGLVHLFQSGSARLLLPRTYGGGAEAVLLNTAGGLTGGDRLDIEATLKPRASLLITTQAAERIYRSAGGTAAINTRLRLGAGAALDWLPQETILFERASLQRNLCVEMAKDARFLGLETLVLGRRAMGETLTYADIGDHRRIWRNGRLLHAESLCYPKETGRARKVTGGARAVASLIYVAPDAEARLAQARELLNFDTVAAAASAWQGKLVLRFHAKDAQPLRKALAGFLTEFRAKALPRVWQM